MAQMLDELWCRRRAGQPGPGRTGRWGASTVAQIVSSNGSCLLNRLGQRPKRMGSRGPRGLMLLVFCLCSFCSPTRPCDVAGPARMVLEENWASSEQWTRPFANSSNMADALASLLSCHALAKSDWKRAKAEFNTLLSYQWQSGMLPKLMYSMELSRVLWLNDSLYPGPQWWWNGQTVARRLAEEGQESSSLTSGLAALPMHSTVALQMYAAQGSNSEGLDFLNEVHGRLMEWHSYLHSPPRADASDGLTLLYHPWEAELPMASSLAAQLVEGLSADSGAQLPPASVQTLPGYPGNSTYARDLGLLECLRHVNYSAPCADFLYKDVEFNAVLRRADMDLLQILTVLDESSDSGSSKKTQQIKEVQGWLSGGFPDAMFSPTLHEFQSSVATGGIGGHSGTFTPVPQSVLDITAVYGAAPIGARMRDAVFNKLLTVGVAGSFQCGPYPIPLCSCNAPSCGGSQGGEDQASWVVHNLLVARGATQNGASAVADWVTNATLLLVAGRTWPGNTSSSCSIAFSPAYSTATGAPLQAVEVNSSTLAAATTLVLLHADSPLPALDDSPLEHTTVVVLMVIELVFAFGVGLAIVSMSVALIQKLRSEGGVRQSNGLPSTTMDLVEGSLHGALDERADGSALDGINSRTSSNASGYVPLRPSTS